MRQENIDKTKELAIKFLGAVGTYKKAIKDSEYRSGDLVLHGLCPRESGALRRASMDLTRALAEMRRP